MSRLRDYRERVVAELRTGVPLLKDVASHGGRFELEDLKRFSLNAPAARVALVGMKPVGLSSDGRLVGPVNMAVYLITAGPDSSDTILDVVEAVADFINLYQWQDTGIGAAKLETIENLYSDKIDKTGLALFAITFEQQLFIGTNLFDKDFAGEADWLDSLAALPQVVITTQGGEVDETIDPADVGL